MMNFTPEEIAQTRKELAGATNWDDMIGISEYLDALTMIEQQREEIARLREAILQLKKLNAEHYDCEDCWYSCPKSGKCCDERLVDYICLCGKDEMDDIINAALKGGAG